MDLPHSSEPIVHAEIVHEKPADGEFEEVLFGSDHGNTLWVKFSDQHGASEWIGKFCCGPATAMRVEKVEDPDRFLIIAGKFAYVVDATRRTLLNYSDDEFVYDFAYDPATGQLIVADLNLRLIEDGQVVWQSEEFSYEYIHDLKVEGRQLTGMAVIGYEDERAPFSFDLDAREFINRPPFPPAMNAPPSLTMTKQIKRIAPLQAGKMLGVLYGLMGLLFLPFFLLSGALASNMPMDQRMGLMAAGMGFSVLAPIFYAVMGFIFGVIGAWLYNLVAKWIGGFEVELE